MTVHAMFLCGVWCLPIMWQCTYTSNILVCIHKMIHVTIILLSTCIQFLCHHGLGMIVRKRSIYDIHGNYKTIIIESINFNNYKNILQNLIMIAKIKRSNYSFILYPPPLSSFDRIRSIVIVMLIHATCTYVVY